VDLRENIILSPQVTFHPIGNEAVLLYEAKQEIYFLNHVAAFIWRMCKQHQRMVEVLNKVSKTFDLGTNSALDHITSILADWERLGLVSGTEASIDPYALLDKTPKPASARGEIARCDSSFASEKRYILAGSIMCVRYACREDEARVHPIFRHLGIECSNQDKVLLGSDSVLFQVLREADETITVTKDGLPVEWGLQPDQIVACLKREFMTDTVQRSGCPFAIHAAAVAKGEYSLILPGPSGSGKSTLAVGLLTAGFNYLSDEVVLLDENFRVWPMPLSVCIKESAWSSIRNVLPQLDSYEIHRRRIDNKAVRYIPPPAALISCSDRQIFLGWVVFPRYKAGTRTTLRPLLLSEGVRILLSSTVLARKLTSERLDQLLGHLRDASFHVLQTSSLEDAITTLTNLVAGGGGTAASGCIHPPSVPI
jgi:hypothetical protein